MHRYGYEYVQRQNTKGLFSVLEISKLIKFIKSEEVVLFLRIMY